MNVTGIMYKLLTVCQPGGSSERVGLLRQLTDPKITGGVGDLLSGLRKWRRLMVRSRELNLSLPDPVILTGVMGKFSDALGKHGGAQMAYRMASARQELAVDVRPTAASIDQYSEYLQAEAEELNLGIGIKAMTSGSGGGGVTLKEGWILWECQEGAREEPSCSYSQAELMGEPATEAASELLKEATGLLKSIRGLKALRAEDSVGGGAKTHVRIKSVSDAQFGLPGHYALLDGGATHALRQAREDELDELMPTQVELAHGTTTLFRHPGHDTLLSTSPVEPIIPLALLVAHGYRVSWRRSGCTIHHHVRGALECHLRSGCPVMDRAKGLLLLADLEKTQRKGPANLSEEELSWWKSHFPEVPSEVWKYMEGQGCSWKDLKPGGGSEPSLPWNRHRRRRMWHSRGMILHLFSGRDLSKWKDLEQRGYVVVCVDSLHGIDLQDAATWAFLWELCCAGKLAAILGGPPCRTTSRLRERRPGPPSLRGRDHLRFALDGLSKWDLHRVHSDTALLMKQLGLYIKAEEKRIEAFGDGMLPTGFVLESPEDPMNYLGLERAAVLPSFWNFPELQGMVGMGGLKLISLDQSETGHACQKPTSLLENLPGLDQLDELRSSSRKTDPLPDGIQASIAASKDWAAWFPGLVEAIKTSLLIYLQQREKCLDQLPSAKKMNIEDWKAHIRAQHRPYRRDCRLCMEKMGIDSPHRRSHADSSAYALSLDLVGPYPLAEMMLDEDLLAM
eukprot:s9_g51.t1